MGEDDAAAGFVVGDLGGDAVFVVAVVVVPLED